MKNGARVGGEYEDMIKIKTSAEYVCHWLRLAALVVCSCCIHSPVSRIWREASHRQSA